MRQDQYERLQQLAEKLTDVLIDELDPAEWPGAALTTEQWRALEKDSREQAKAIRGDRYWHKKSAGMTLTVLTKVHTVIGMVQRAAVVPPEDAPAEDDIETEMAAAEKEAQHAIDAALKRARGGRRQ